MLKRINEKIPHAVYIIHSALGAIDTHEILVFSHLYDSAENSANSAVFKRLEREAI